VSSTRTCKRRIAPPASLAAGFAIVLNATNTEQADIIVVAVVRVHDAVVHVPVVSAAATVLTGTPPVAVVADTVEIAIRIAVAARQGGKAEVVRTVAQFSFVIIPTAFCFEFLACNFCILLQNKEFFMTMTLEIKNPAVLNIIRQLESLQMLNVVNSLENSKVNWRKFRGSVAKQSREEIDLQLKELRDEWERT